MGLMMHHRFCQRIEGVWLLFLLFRHSAKSLDAQDERLATSP